MKEKEVKQKKEIIVIKNIEKENLNIMKEAIQDILEEREKEKDIQKKENLKGNIGHILKEIFEEMIHSINHKAANNNLYINKMIRTKLYSLMNK